VADMLPVNAKRVLQAKLNCHAVSSDQAPSTTIQELTLVDITMAILAACRGPWHRRSRATMSPWIHHDIEYKRRRGGVFQRKVSCLMLLYSVGRWRESETLWHSSITAARPSANSPL
jgi:hypothetical protein